MLQMIFVLEKCERSGTCENKHCLHTIHIRVRQKVSVKASNYYLISQRFKATEKVVVHWLEVLR